MSKSLDNILDPLDVIKEYGTDALRLALVMGATPGNDLKVGDEKLAAMRNFVNKLWNVSRYLRSAGITALPTDLALPHPNTLADRWILSRLSEVSDAVTSFLQNYEISLAGEVLRDFTWNEFADWYVEIHKIEKNDAVLSFVFETLLRLWHPFMPFVTEAIYQSFHDEEMLLVAKWPKKIDARNTEAAEQFAALQDLITSVRNLRSLYHIEPRLPMKYSLSSSQTFFEENKALVERLANASLTTHDSNASQAKIIRSSYEAALFLEGVIDIQKEKNRLETEKGNLEKYLSGIRGRLADSNFTVKAPAAVIEQNRTALIETGKKIEEIEKALAGLN